MHRRLNAPTQFFLACLFLFALWLAGLHWFTRHVGDAPGGNGHARADAIVVLTGGSNRLQTGFDLLEKNLGKKLFISGVYRGVEVRELLRLWREEGHDDLKESVTLGFDADDTIGNARETAEWLRREKFRSFYLVTANYHLRRALLEFKIIAPGFRIISYPVTPEGLDMNNWWRNKAHRILIIKEYMKYLVTLFRYTITV